jgi:CBS domain-containing protein
MQVSEIMHRGVSTVQINDSIKMVAALMKNKDIGAVPVYKNERPVGFVTDRDIVVSCVARGHPIEDPISHAMKSELFTITESEDVSVAASIMGQKQISRLLVVDKGNKPVGMISIQDLAHSEHGHEDVITNIKRH